MSYWNEIEKMPGELDYKHLDKQIEKIVKAGGQITLCLGARQPRWPENHWPDWAWNMDKSARSDHLLQFVETTVARYRKNKHIVSYQLENEALLDSFGERSEVDRARLRTEYNLVKKLDPKTPVIMTTSSAFGIPVIGPIPDIVGFSFYKSLFNESRGYQQGKQTVLSVIIRKILIRLFWRTPSFIHELQLEPWGPKNIWEMHQSEQDKSMSPKQIKTNLDLAKKTGVATVDLWGGEWWYWRSVVQKDKSIWQAVSTNIN